MCARTDSIASTMSPRRSDSRASQRYRLGKRQFSDRRAQRPRRHDVNPNTEQFRELFRKSQSRKQFSADGTGMRKLDQEVDVAAARVLAARYRTEDADVVHTTVRQKLEDANSLLPEDRLSW
jgi:hypothetical protein